MLSPGIRELEIFDFYNTPLAAAVKEDVKLLVAKEMVPVQETVEVCAYRHQSTWLRRRLREACWAAHVPLQGQLLI